MAAVDLERLRALRRIAADVDHLAGECLHHRGRQDLRELRQVGAAFDAAEPLAHRLAKPVHEVQPRQAAIRVAMRVARTRERHCVAARTGFDDVEALVDDDAQQHVVNRLARDARPRGKRGRLRPVVADLRIDFPETIAACVDADVDGAAVNERALGRGDRQGHGRSRAERRRLQSAAVRRGAAIGPVGIAGGGEM